MKCPQCKAWTTVKETREKADGSVYRRYVCANEHRFSTKETAYAASKPARGPDGKFRRAP